LAINWQTSNVADLYSLDGQYLRDNYLMGIDLLDDSGNLYPEKWWEQRIAMAATVIDRYCKLKLAPTTLYNEVHDYYYNDYQNYVFLKMFYGPIRWVNQIQIVYPTNQTGTVLPTAWAIVSENSNQIQLVPTAGTLSQVIIGQGGSFLPLVVNGLSYLPGLFHIDYTVGFPQNTVILKGCTPGGTVGVLMNNVAISVTASADDIVTTALLVQAFNSNPYVGAQLITGIAPTPQFRAVQVDTNVIKFHPLSNDRTMSLIPFGTGVSLGGPQVPIEIIEAICKLACIEALTICADLIYPPGLTSQSISIDGMSESRGIMNSGRKAPVFTGRIQQYTEDLYGSQQEGRKGLLNEIRDTWHMLDFATA
jgi:hypothetical protein